jgi:hypothetical protein
MQKQAARLHERTISVLPSFKCLAFGIFYSTLSLSLNAATNLISADEIPPLRPPRDELPPDFWEQHTASVSIGALLLVLLAGLLIWLWFRPKPPPVLTPPVLQARRELELLRTQPENGLVLSRVSQVVRRYFSIAFILTPDERTTREFCRALSGVTILRPEISAAVADFLQECDHRKFAPAASLPPLDAVSTAERLIAEAEASREAVPPIAAEAPKLADDR